MRKYRLISPCVVAATLLALLFASGGVAEAAQTMRAVATLPAPSVTSGATATAAPVPTGNIEGIPVPIDGPEDSYFTEKEKVAISAAGNHWRYTSPTLYVDIRKVRLKSRDITFFAADIRTRDEKAIRSGVYASEKRPDDLARQFSAVYAQNGDFFTLEQSLKGTIIHNGKVLSNRKGADTFAVMPDGTLKVFAPGATTPQKLLAMGVRDTWSFGPTLIKDGVMRTNFNWMRNHGKNPRSGFGMIGKGHYVGIVVGGRNPGYSVGMTYTEFADLFRIYGCKLAYCFDGGASSAMVFMGRALPINVRMMGTTKVTVRRIPDIFIVGKSSLVPK